MAQVVRMRSPSGAGGRQDVGLSRRPWMAVSDPIPAASTNSKTTGYCHERNHGISVKLKHARITLPRQESRRYVKDWQTGYRSKQTM